MRRLGVTRCAGSGRPAVEGAAHSAAAEASPAGRRAFLFGSDPPRCPIVPRWCRLCYGSDARCCRSLQAFPT